MKQILLVDDDKDVSKSLANLFDTEKFKFHFLEDGDKVTGYLQDHSNVDLVMLDVNLPSLSGLEILKEIKQTKESLPVIMISGFVSTENAIEAMSEGAFEYLTKPFEIDKLIDTVNKACGYCQPEAKAPLHAPTKSPDISHHEIIGRSPEIVEIAKLIGQVAKTDAAVLIFGESGTGKELVAEAIHRNSKRRGNAFLSVNCAALPENLLESELFGHEKGAFTGAYYKRIGRFEQADNGSLFLDEIGDMSMLTQSKLLRVLQEKTFTRVGGNDTINGDVRIIAATNKSLVQLMKEGSFRVDLFYRLKVVSIYIPPLRERREDIPLLADYFVNKYSEALAISPKQISKKALQQISRYHWAGNVRELENNIHTAMVMSKGDILNPEDFPSLSDKKAAEEPDLNVIQDDYTETFKKLIDPIMPRLISTSSGQIYHFLESALEKAMLASCLKQFDGNQVKTSEVLGISRNTLRDRIAKYGLY